MAVKLKNIALAIAILILLNLFVYTGIRTFYKEPDRSKYCLDYRVPIITEEDCVAGGGQWVENPVDPNVQEKPRPSGNCTDKPTCFTLYEEAIKPYNRNVFIIYVVLGLITLLIGLLLKVDAVSAGLNFGAVILFFTGTVRYWSNMQEYLRFIIVGLALAIVIWMGYKKLSK